MLTSTADIRNFVANTLSAAVVEADRAYVRKLDAVLVEVSDQRERNGS